MSAMSGTPEKPGTAPGSTQPGSTPTAGEGTGARSALLRVVPLALSVVAVIAALVCVVVFAISASGATETETAREDATQAAEQAVLNITTIDPADLDEFKRRVDASLTGQAKDEVLGTAEKKPGQQQNVLEMLAEAGPNAAKLSARLLRSAPSEVNAEEEKAKVLVYVVTTLQRPDQPPVEQTRGFNVSMVKSDGAWKAENVVGLEGIEYADAGGGAAPAAPEGGN